MCLKLGHAKFQLSIPRGTFSNWGLNEVEGKKDVRSPTENFLYLENGKRYGLGYY